MGSYPFSRDGKPGTQLVLRSIYPEMLAQAFAEWKTVCAEKGWLA